MARLEVGLHLRKFLLNALYYQNYTAVDIYIIMTFTNTKVEHFALYDIKYILFLYGLLKKHAG